MSVRVSITQHPGNAFRRELLISRLSNVGVHATPAASHSDMVSDYEVELAGGRLKGTARFEHRYGDPVMVLVEKAIQALRAAGLEDEVQA